MKYYTETLYVDKHTGEEISKWKIEQNKYLLIETEVTYEKYKDNIIRRIIKLAITNPQLKLEL